MERIKRSKKQWGLLILGLTAICIGSGILGFLGIRKLSRMVKKQKLLAENPVLEIPALKIKAPVLEGTGNDVLAKAVGHFPGTGDFGSGNYCVAGHSSTLYKEYFNPLKNAEAGMQINLYDKENQCFSYFVTEITIVEPDETWILNDFGDNRITLVTCTDDGTQRRIVVGTANDDTQKSTEP